MRRAICIAALALCAAPALADDVVLKEGRTLTGIVRSQDGEAVAIEVAAGTATIRMADVARVEKGKKTDLHRYYERERDAKDAAGFVLLAEWAKEKGLGRFYRPCMRRALELDPRNEAARGALGFQLHQGKWMTEEEIMISRGLVLVDGKWIKPEDRLALLEQELNAEKKEMEGAFENEKREWKEKDERLEEARREFVRPFDLLHRMGMHLPQHLHPFPCLFCRYRLPPDPRFFHWPYEAPSSAPASPEEYEKRLREAMGEYLKGNGGETGDGKSQDGSGGEGEKEQERKPEE